MLCDNDNICKIFFSAINLSDNQILINNQTEIANFGNLNGKQGENLIEKEPNFF